MARKRQPKAPAFQLYPRDLLFKTQHLSNEKLGAYIRLLFTAWDPPPCSTGKRPAVGHLPNEPAVLAEIARSAPDSDVLRAALSFFEEAKNAATILSPRMVEVWRDQVAYSKSRSSNGKKGGRPAGTGKPHGKHMVSTGEAQTEAQKSPASASAIKDEHVAHARDPRAPTPRQHAQAALARHGLHAPTGDLCDAFATIGQAYASATGMDPGAAIASAVDAYAAYRASCSKPPGWASGSVLRHRDDVQPIMAGVIPLPVQRQDAEEREPEEPRWHVPNAAATEAWSAERRRKLALVLAEQEEERAERARQTGRA